MKVIYIKTCGECPFMETSHCGKKANCKHPKLMVKFPYANDRQVEADKEPPKFCMLKEMVK